MKNRALSFLSAVAFLAAGCSSLYKSDQAALQGGWSGFELGGSTESVCRMLVTDNQISYSGSTSTDWFKGTFTLRQDTQPKQLLVSITQAPSPGDVGKPLNVIYKYEANSLTVCANPPGDTNAPATFGAPGTRNYLFKRNPGTMP